MKKTTLVLVISLLLALMLTGCGVEYCSVSGCPKEAFANSDYCPEHKCSNYSCSNEAVDSYSYCIECFERAQ